MLNSKKLQEVRKGLQISQQELADRIGVTGMTIFRYEADKSEVNFNKLKKIVDVFNEGKTFGDFEYKSKKHYKIEDFVKN